MKSIITGLLMALGLTGCSQAPKPIPKPQFVFVKIPEKIMPLERGKKYGDPLDAFLKKAGAGEVSGGGEMMSAKDEQGHRTIEWIGLDVDLTDFEKGLPLLKAELLKLGVPEGTTLEYTQNGTKKSERVK